MTKRDEFALMAAEVMLEKTALSLPPFNEIFEKVAHEAYVFADAMLEAGKNKKHDDAPRPDVVDEPALGK